MATLAALDVENPSTHLDVNLKTPTGEDVSTYSLATSNESNNIQVEIVVFARDDDGSGAVIDIQKKMKSVERFGMPVHLSEEEKRNARAERFGTGTAVNESDSSKPSEELKKKTTASREVRYCEI